MSSETRPENPHSQPTQTESFAEAILKDIDLSRLPDERWRECVRQLAEPGGIVDGRPEESAGPS